MPSQYQTASIAGGPLHVPTRYKSVNGVSLHPLQRTGQVSSGSHALAPVTGAGGFAAGLGHAAYPAAQFTMALPPVLTLAGSPRDGNFMV